MKKESSERTKANQLGLQSGELTHFAAILLELSPAAWGTITGLPDEDRMAILQAGLLYAQTRFSQGGPSRLTPLKTFRVSKGLSLAQMARELNKHTSKLLGSGGPELVDKLRRALPRRAGEHLAKIDIDGLESGDSEAKANFRHAAEITESNLRSLESGYTKDLRLEPRIVIESFWGAPLDQLIAPKRS